MSIESVRLLPEPAGRFELALHLGSTYSFEPFVQVHPDGEDNLGNCEVIDITDLRTGHLERCYRSLWRIPKLGSWPGWEMTFSGDIWELSHIDLVAWYDRLGRDLLQYPYPLSAEFDKRFFADGSQVYPYRQSGLTALLAEDRWNHRVNFSLVSSVLPEVRPSYSVVVV